MPQCRGDPAVDQQVNARNERRAGRCEEFHAVRDFHHRSFAGDWGCRQKIAEFAAQDVRVTLCTTDGKARVMTVADLLPGVFTAAHMDRV